MSWNKNWISQSNVDGALRAYDKAVEASTQREVKLLCLHEVAWCHLICLNYEHAYRSLVELQQQSRWSKAFYAYLAAGKQSWVKFQYVEIIYVIFSIAVCLGATGNIKDLLRTYWKIARLVAATSKESQLGIFILRRAPKLVDVNTGQPFNNTVYYKFLVYELLYLWNAMPSCSTESLQRMLAGRWITRVILAKNCGNRTKFWICRLHRQSRRRTDCRLVWPDRRCGSLLPWLTEFGCSKLQKLFTSTNPRERFSRSTRQCFCTVWTWQCIIKWKFEGKFIINQNGFRRC